MSSVFLALLLCGCDQATSPGPSSASGSNSTAAPANVSTATAPWFQDITEASGIRFVHAAGTNYFMPDQVGSGVALLDIDNDGRLDVYCVQNGGGADGRRNQLFHQEPGGTFRDVTDGSGADLAGRGMGAIAGDVNNDGRCDLLVTEYGAVRLLVNLGQGKFQEIEARVSGLDNPRWAAPASFLDYDRDGWLDVVVGNYVDYDPTHLCSDVQGRRDFCAPGAFGNTVTRLWRNATGTPGGPPRFEERTEPAGLAKAPGAALAVVCVDFDGDGWADIFCSDDGRPNRLFINRRDGTFTEEAARRGLALNAMGATAANMGTTLGDVDGDGLWEVFVTHLSEEFHGFWKQGPRGLFLDQIAASGLQNQAWRGTGFGTVFADFNLDGHPDLALANGLVRRAVPGQTPVHPDVSAWWARYAQRAQIFANDGAGRFTDLSLSNPGLCGHALVGRSLAAGDLDRDGAPDLIVGGIGGGLRVYRNTAPRRGHWLSVRLLDPAHGGRDAIGAEFVVHAGGRRWWSAIQPATSYLASHDPSAQIGLGAAASVDRIEVLWPDGAREKFTAPAIDQALVFNKGQGEKMPGSL